MDRKKLTEFIDQTWDQSIIPCLMDYIRIPNKSPLFDRHWQQHGYVDQAAALLKDWCQHHAANNMKIEVLRAENRTPVIFIEIPGQSDDTVLLYGHFDKQPEMSGWASDLGPWQPVLKGDKLYGRGAADDGYAIFTALTAINALQQQQIPHARCVILIEASEESGSIDLPYYLESLYQRLGTPSLVVCLDSGCGNYEQLWITTSLRGNLVSDLKVELITEGVHSGNATGVVPSSFRVLRQLLERIEDEASGKMLVDELFVDIPQQRKQQAADAADVLQQQIYEQFPFYSGVKPVTDDLQQLVLNRTWRPGLSVIGMSGIPNLENAGNVMLPYTQVRLSIRIPPRCEPEKANKALKTKLETMPSYNARVTYTPLEAVKGWEAPAVSPWLSEAAAHASELFFGKKAIYMGEGATIPFMAMLGEKFPRAEFFITGVLGPQANAHGPNEFLHIPMGKRVTSCVAHVLMAHFKKTSIR